jgi:50S ribosomal subunit-associated GTPase HflX
MPWVKVMFCREQTFATLDTTVRKVVIKLALLAWIQDLSETANN